MVLQGCSKGVSRDVPGCLKGVTRGVKECFKSVQRVLRRCPMGVLIYFEGVSRVFLGTF